MGPWTSMAIPMILLVAVASGDNRDSVAELPLARQQSHEELAIVRETTGATKKVPWKHVIGRRVTIQAARIRVIRAEILVRNFSTRCRGDLPC